METLKRNSRGSAVVTLQKLLNLCPDGIFGEITEEAVKALQKEQGITPVDGIVGPKTWAKLQGSNTSVSKRKINEIILHCTATPEGKEYSNAEITIWHKNRGFNTIGYHYVIGLKGEVRPGRDINVIGAHCKNHNSHSIGICYVGGLEDIPGKPISQLPSKDTRTPEQKKALVKLVKELMVKYNLTTEQIHGHYQYDNKACPSFKIETFKQELKTL